MNFENFPRWQIFFISEHNNMKGGYEKKGQRCLRDFIAVFS